MLARSLALLMATLGSSAPSLAQTYRCTEGKNVFFQRVSEGQIYSKQETTEGGWQWTNLCAARGANCRIEKSGNFEIETIGGPGLFLARFDATTGQLTQSRPAQAPSVWSIRRRAQCAAAEMVYK